MISWGIIRGGVVARDDILDCNLILVIFWGIIPGGVVAGV